MKEQIKKILAEVFYRLRILIKGPISQKELEKLLKRESSLMFNRWYNFLKAAYIREYAAFICAQDSWATSMLDNPFINNSIIDKYEGEFSQVLKENIYQPGGMIPTELFLLYCLIRHYKPDIFVESGTKYAYSSIFIAEALKKNEKGKLYCLSLFKDDEYKIAAKRLEPYDAVIIQGLSEVNIDKLTTDLKTAILIDGPKARTKNWDILNQKINQNFTNLLFLCFDACQEHVPYHDDYSPRGINMERLKVLKLYREYYEPKGFKLIFQSNQFCRNYQYLNEEVYKYRNERWGKFFPFGPYKVDRIGKHIAYAYKMGVIIKDTPLFIGKWQPLYKEGPQ